MRILGYAFLIIMAVFAFTLINITILQPTRIVNKTFDADNVIYNYEWFKQQYEDIAAVDQKIVNVQLALSNTPQTDLKADQRSQLAMLNSQLLGLQNQRTQMVADYNARAQMMNRSLFLVGSPPHV